MMRCWGFCKYLNTCYIKKTSLVKQRIGVFLGLIYNSLKKNLLKEKNLGMKKFLFVLLFSITTLLSFANHTKGGWMYYEYLGPGSSANTLKYRIILKLYMRCDHTPEQLDPDVPFTIFNAANLAQVDNISVPLLSTINIRNCSTQECYPCIQRIPNICYTIATYELIQDLPASTSGYIISFQRCCRIISIVNIQDPSNDVGDTWSVTIPGSIIPGAQFNSSARFAQNDTAIICAGSSFVFDFSAVDPNGDSLTYAFTSAYNGGSSSGAGGGAAPNPAAAPPYNIVPYAGGFSGTQPMGSGVTIDPKTGMVSGIAPASGIYVLTATVSEYNKVTRQKIAEIRKSLHIEVADCNKTEAKLKPVYPNCDSLTVHFKNESLGVDIQTYDWDFGDGNTSTLPEPAHTYLTAGDYILKLVVNRGLDCSDSTTSVVKVYPGFRPDFDVFGQCTNTLIQFKDKTTADFGSVNSWSWNFGDLASTVNNTSALQFPTHVFSTAADYNIQFVVGSSVGCIDTVNKKITIFDHPPLELTNDTLICSVDTLQLNAIGTGNIVWSPNYMISDINSHTPLVSPDVTTKYYVTLTDAFGCTGTDSVKINVVDHVTQFLPLDTTICQTDPIVLHLTSDALYFLWTSTPNNGSIVDPMVKTPTVNPLTTTTYHVVGSISNKCFAQNDIKVTVVPYPIPNVGPDVPVCFGFSTQLHASGGAFYTWKPAIFLSATNIPDPMVVNPTSDVRYVVAVRDTLGCPKTVLDTVFVNVIRVHADAGPSDTSVVIGQPLQLNATGGSHYLWSPAKWLSLIDIPNPVSLPQGDIKYFVLVSDDNGCKDTDSIRVHFFRLAAGLYVPNAFTPNRDGTNDIFRPIELGLKTLDIFKVYNRWGELVFSTSDMNKGWDGTYKGRGQDPGTYVWYGEGTDYTGKKVSKKGTVILIRE
jgi:gliding motility-associated-like protein